jgi:4-hydroxy-2-oxoheptanedioate aldolase
MVQFGPADYAMSIGRTGDWSHPEVRAAERRTIEAALARGIHPRAEISEPSQAARFLEMGVRHFCIGWDVTILNAAWRANGEGMLSILAGAGGGKGRGGARKPARGKGKAARTAKRGGNYR